MLASPCVEFIYVKEKKTRSANGTKCVIYGICQGNCVYAFVNTKELGNFKLK